MNKSKIASLLIVLITVVATFVIVLVAIASTNSTALQTNPQASQGWSTVFTEDFESGIDGNVWTVSDIDGATGGEYYWATTSYTASQGTYSAWVAGGGADGTSLEAGVDNYPDNALSSLVHDPVDFSSLTGARLTFDYWSLTQPTFDVIQIAVSTDGSNYNDVWNVSGGTGQWQSANIDLNAYLGESSVWLQFFFSSNASVNNTGVFIDNIVLESSTDSSVYLPLLRKDPTQTPIPFYYFDDFSDPNSGWPIIDHRWDPTDCFQWYYSNVETYRGHICDDRTDVKVSPLVDLPEGDYKLSVDARFRGVSGDRWWASYGILFDAKDEPDPNKPDLGDYYLLWILWEGESYVKWTVLKDIPGDYFPLFDWEKVNPAYYDYGNGGTNFNHWEIVRTDNTISVSVNGVHLKTINEARPTTNYQTLFGVFNSTYETNIQEVAFDNYKVEAQNGSMAFDFQAGNSGYAVYSGEFSLENALPNRR